MNTDHDCKWFSPTEEMYGNLTFQQLKDWNESAHATHGPLDELRAVFAELTRLREEADTYATLLHTEIEESERLRDALLRHHRLQTREAERDNACAICALADQPTEEKA